MKNQSNKINSVSIKKLIIAVVAIMMCMSLGGWKEINKKPEPDKSEMQKVIKDEPIKPEEKTKVKPEIKPEVKLEEKPEKKPEKKPEEKPEEKPEIKPEVKSEKKTEAKEETNLEETDVVVETTELTEVQYPDAGKRPLWENCSNYKEYSDAYDEWFSKKSEQDKRTEKLDSEKLALFNQTTMKEILKNDGEYNVAYSPVNFYIALGMLAEITNGETRQQVLDLMNVKDIEEAREQVYALWNANYIDDGITKSLLANSLWMSENVNYKQETLDMLAKEYFASAFKGKMGSEEMNETLQNWTNEQTNNLLTEYVKDLRTNPETVLMLMSTIYFKASWCEEFKEWQTWEDIFYTKNGEITCDFMNENLKEDMYYWGDKFTAVKKRMENEGKMWFILPDENVDVNDIVDDIQIQQLVMNERDYQDKKTVKLYMSVPKFDVSSEVELSEIMANMGVTDIFDDTKADFSNIFEDTSNPVVIDEIKHAARVKIDESGCEAAAYTEMSSKAVSMPPEWLEEVYFVANRPFLFVVTNAKGNIVFTGVVNQPTND